MYLPHLVIIIAAVSVILFWFGHTFRQDLEQRGQAASPAAIVLAAWIVAAALFGPNFFVLLIPGLFDITIERALFAVIMVVLLIGAIQGKVRLRESFSVELVMGLFLLVCLISMLRMGFLPAIAGLPSPWFVFISGYLFPFIVFVFAKYYIKTEQDASAVLHALFYFGLYLSVIAFFEYNNLRQYVYPRYINDPLLSPLHLERARGPFLNSGFNGGAILFGFISGVHLLEKKTGFARFFHLAALLLFFPAVFFTQTRMIYLSLMIAIVIFMLWYKTNLPKWKLISLPLVMVLIVGMLNAPRLLSTERREGGVMQMDEIDIRIALLQRSYHLFTLNPVAGVGLAQFIPASVTTRSGRIPFAAEEAPTQYQHNHLLGIATELGILGLLIYMFLIALILRRLQLLSGKLANTGLMGSNLRVTVFAFFCVYLNINMFMEPSTSLFFNAVPFLFAGVADGLYSRSLQADAAKDSLQSKSATIQPRMRLMSRHV